MAWICGAGHLVSCTSPCANAIKNDAISHVFVHPLTVCIVHCVAASCILLISLQSIGYVWLVLHSLALSVLQVADVVRYLVCNDIRKVAIKKKGDWAPLLTYILPVHGCECAWWKYRIAMSRCCITFTSLPLNSPYSSPLLFPLPSISLPSPIPLCLPLTWLLTYSFYMRSLPQPSQQLLMMFWERNTRDLLMM